MNETLQNIKQIIFSLDKENIIRSINLIINKFDHTHPYSFNLIIIHMLYISFILEVKDYGIYIKFIMEIQKFEENKKIKPAFNKILKNYLLCRQYEHESFYLLDKLIECSFIEPYIFKDIAYFIHRFPKKGYQIVISDKFHRKIAENYEELSKNDWELHKKLIEEGVNPNEIAKMIRNNEIEKLQEISSQPNFDFNQTIEPSLYERCSFISQSNVTLIDYAAFFSSVKCFKYLLMNGANVYNAGKYAVAGGNLEIIHLCQQNHVSFKDAYETAIQFHKNNIFKYLYENKILIVNSSEKLGAKCIKYYNYELFTFLEKEGMDVTNYIINKTAKIGNLYLVKYFLHNHQIPNDIIVSSIKSQNIELIKFLLMQKGFDINAKNIYGETALIYASKKGYTKIVKLLLEQEGIDINAKNIDGRTALIIATFYHRIKIIEMLLNQKEIDLNVKDIDQRTAFMSAILEGDCECVQLFIEKEGIDINTFDEYGRTPLMLASEKGKTEIIKLLLKQNVININSKNNDGKTALIIASEKGFPEIVKLLLFQKGININVIDNNGKTAYAYATQKRNIKICCILFFCLPKVLYLMFSCISLFVVIFLSFRWIFLGFFSLWKLYTNTHVSVNSTLLKK